MKYFPLSFYSYFMLQNEVEQILRKKAQANVTFLRCGELPLTLVPRQVNVNGIRTTSTDKFIKFTSHYNRY